MNNFTQRRFLLLGLILFTANATASVISGAGATFPSTIYKGWAKSFQEQANVELKYQDTGSGDGIKQIQAKSVDFGA